MKKETEKQLKSKIRRLSKDFNEQKKLIEALKISLKDNCYVKEQTRKELEQMEKDKNHYANRCSIRAEEYDNLYKENEKLRHEIYDLGQSINNYKLISNHRDELSHENSKLLSEVIELKKAIVSQAKLL